MTDANVAVNFTASVGDLVSGVADAKDALTGLSEPFAQLNGQYAALGASIGEAFAPTRLQGFDSALMTSASLEKTLAAAHAQTAEAIRTSDEATSADAIRTAKLAISEEIKAVEDGLKQKLALYADEARQHQITQMQKVALSRQALDEEYGAQISALQREAALDDQSGAQKQRIDDQMLDAERRHQDQMTALVRNAVNEQEREYQAFGNTVTQAFNSQLHGLLSGTENWHTAFKNVLEDLLIKFIEWGEETVVRQIATEAAKTAATTAGVTRAPAPSRGARRLRWLRNRRRSFARSFPPRQKPSRACSAFSRRSWGRSPPARRRPRRRRSPAWPARSPRPTSACGKSRRTC